MMSLLANSRVALDVMENFQGVIGDALNVSRQIGLPVAGIMIVITVILIFFGNGKEAPNHVRKLIWICVGVIIIANIGHVVTLFTTIGEKIFNGEVDAYENLPNYKPDPDGFISLIRTFIK